MSWDSDTAQTRIRLCARKPTQHQCAIGWHLSSGELQTEVSHSSSRVAVRTLPHGAPPQLIATQP